MILGRLRPGVRLLSSTPWPTKGQQIGKHLTDQFYPADLTLGRPKGRPGSTC